MQGIHRWSQSPLHFKISCLSIILWSHWMPIWYFSVSFFCMASVQSWPVELGHQQWIKSNHFIDRSVWLFSCTIFPQKPLNVRSFRGCEDAEDFKDAICEQMETFFPFVLHFWICSENNGEIPHFFLKKRILPFTYGYVISKSDYCGDMLSRASQCEELPSLIIRSYTEVQFVKGISTVNGKEQAVWTGNLSCSTTGMVDHPLKIIIFSVYERQSLDNHLSLYWNNLNGRRCRYSLNR